MSQPLPEHPFMGLMRWQVLVVVVAAVATRICYCAWGIGFGAGLSEGTRDAYDYDRLGWAIAGDEGYVTADGKPTASRTPGYPLFIAGIYRVVGHRPGTVRLAQCFLGGWTVLMVYLLGKKVFDERVGLTAAALLAVYPLHIGCAGVLLSETLFLALLWSGVLFLVIALRTKRLWIWALLGMLLGVAALARPVALGLFVLLPVVGVWRRWGRAVGVRGANWIAYGACAVLVIAPWLIRNKVKMGSVVLWTQCGRGLWGANNDVILHDPRAYGYWVNPATLPGAGTKLAGVTDEVQRDRIMMRQGASWLMEHPEHWPQLVLMRCVRFFSPVLMEWRSREGVVHLVSYGPLFPFMVCGTMMAWRKQERTIDVEVLLTLVAFGILIAICTVGYARYRLAIEPVLLLLAAHALCRAASAILPNDNACKAPPKPRPESDERAASGTPLALQPGHS